MSDIGADQDPKPGAMHSDPSVAAPNAAPETVAAGESNSRREALLIDAVISALPSGIITTDMSGRISHVNRAAAETLGRNREHLVGVHLTSLRGELEAMLWPSDKGEILLLAPGRPGELQFTETRVLGFSSRPVQDVDGHPTGMVVSFSDITEAKARARAEAHKQRLADIGKVVSSVAHEIRNPVFAIASLAQVLSTEEEIGTNAVLSEMVGKILEEARRIGRLVDDLLAFGRERPIERKRTDVVELVATLVSDLQRGLLRTEAGSLPVPFRVHVTSSIRRDPIWDLDADAIRRVLANLIRNAWHAVVDRSLDRDPHDGVDVHLDRGPDWLEIAIEDQGVGIPRERLTQVFEAFYSTRHHGTGLGLSIADRLVRQHRGTISLESTLGTGTKVLVRIPA